MSDRSIKIAVILSAVDRMSSVINNANRNAQKAFDFGKKSAIVGASFAAPLIYATKKAIDFEDKMADVAKVYNTKIGDSTFLQLSEQAKDLSEYLSKTSEESSGLMASLGQGGVDIADLTRISQDAGQMSVAFDLTADIAGDRYTKLKNALNSSWVETKKAGDAINYLSDSQASKASEILDFMAAGGAGVARASRTAGKDLAAMGSYLISVGKSGAESSTIIERLYKGIMKSDSSRGIFMKAGQGTAGFLAVLQKGANIKDPGNRFKYFKQFGEYGTEIMSMAGNMDQLKTSISSVADESSFLGSVEKEFLNRNSTTRGQMKKGWAELSRIILDFGSNGLPIIIDLMNTIRPIVKSIGDFIKNNKELTGTIFKVLAGISALSFTVSALSFAFGGVFKAISILATGFRFLRSAQLAYHTAALAGTAITGSLKAAIIALNLAFLMNPVFLIVVGIMALVAAFIIAYNKCEKFRAIVDGVVEVGKLLLNVFKAVGKVIMGIWDRDPRKILEGLSDVGNIGLYVAKGGIQKTFSRGYDASIATSRAMTASERAAQASKSVSKSNNISPITGSGPTPVPTKSLYSSINFSPTINLSGSATKADAKLIAKESADAFKKSLQKNEEHKLRVSY